MINERWQQWDKIWQRCTRPPARPSAPTRGPHRPSGPAPLTELTCSVPRRRPSPRALGSAARTASASLRAAAARSRRTLASGSATEGGRSGWGSRCRMEGGGERWEVGQWVGGAGRQLRQATDRARMGLHAEHKARRRRPEGPGCHRHCRVRTAMFTLPGSSANNGQRHAGLREDGKAGSTRNK